MIPPRDIMADLNELPISPRQRFRRYSHVRKVELPWGDSLPSNWRFQRLRFLATINPVKSEIKHLHQRDEVSFVPMEAVREFGGMELGQTRLFEDVQQGYTYFRDGDVVLAKITPCFENGKGSIAEGLTNGIAFGTTELHVLRAGSELDRRFLFYFTMSQPFRAMGVGEMYGAGGQKRVPDEFLRNCLTPLPPLPEQRAIAAFLDRETARIDALIAKKRQLIDLLREKRSAMIGHAVTKGIDPAAPMKPSGIEWLGEVPAHWEVKRLRFSLRSFEQGWSPQCENRLADEIEWAVLKVGCVNGSSFDPTEHKALPSELQPIPEFEVRPGDILMSRANTRELLGSAAFVESIRPRLMLCDKLYRIRVDEEVVLPRFLVMVFRAAISRFQFEREADGASGSMKNIGQDSVKNLRLAIPSIREQEAIIASIHQRTETIDKLVSLNLDAVDRLTEYRSALISAAVTGKIDVRGEATA